MKYKIVYKSLGGADNLGNRIPFNNQSLQIAVNLWNENREQAITLYGEINTWDVSRVTNMSSLFFDKTFFNDDISNWDTSNVTDMQSMFEYAASFNQDISNWNTSKVTNMEDIFQNATQFNNDSQPLNTREVVREDTIYTAWNVSNVTNMEAMFAFAHSFNQDISNWDVSNVTDMSYMFNDARLFNQSISNWNTYNVNQMDKMFQGAELFNQDISNWNTSNVTNMDSMFAFATAFNNNNEPLTTIEEVQRDDGTTYTAWDVSNVTDMTEMFNGAESFNQDISNWDVSNVTDMTAMFIEAGSFNQDIGYWNVSNVTAMTAMFIDAREFNQHKIGLWIINDNCDIDEMFDGSGVTRGTFEGEVYGQRIADYFHPPLEHPLTNEQLELYSRERRIQERNQFNLAMYGKYKDISNMWNQDNQLIYLNKIPETINGVTNPDFPVISNRKQLRTRLDIINNRKDDDYTKDENRIFNLNNQFIDDQNRVFELFKINNIGERIMLFEFDKNDNLIVKEEYTGPVLNDDQKNTILSFIGGRNNKLYNDYKI